jgi:hypothetical protein
LIFYRWWSGSDIVLFGIEKNADGNEENGDQGQRFAHARSGAQTVRVSKGFLFFFKS